MTEIPSCILPQYVWYNANIQIIKTSNIHGFPKKNIHYNSQLFNDNGSLKKQLEFKGEYD